MFKPFEGGSVEHIQGLDCHIPPIGMVPDYYSGTGELIKSEILFTDKPQKDQKWQRQPLPDWYPKKLSAELIVRDSNPSFRDDDLQQVRKLHWQRRLNGVWVMINGKPVYLTGKHWFYLNWWPLDTGFPFFRENDRLQAYFWQYCIEDPDCGGMIEATKRKNGKCFIINTLIRMYDGSIKKVQDIKDGEYVMGDDSTPRLVYGSTSGQEEMFEIIPKKGKSFTVNKSHIIYAIKTSSLKSGVTKKEAVKFTVEEYLNFSDNLKLRLKLCKTGWKYKEKTHVVNPYFLGLWLGDGVSRCLQITNEDIEIIDYLKSFSLENGLKYHDCGQRSLKGVKLQHLISGGKNGIRSSLKEGDSEILFDNTRQLMKYLGRNPKTPLKTFGRFRNGDIKILGQSRNQIWDEFKKLNLPSNKHIPKEYLIDSRENRLQLLAGLLDSDGCLVRQRSGGGMGYYKIGCSNEKLKNDIVELIQSLGFYCGEGYYDKTKSFTLSIYGDIHLIPCKVGRKKVVYKKRIYDSLLSGFTVKSVGHGEYYGFAVDDNHLFLLADGTVVHNTYRAGCYQFEYSSRITEALMGIQSKIANDARDQVYMFSIVTPFKKLPDFFRPIYDTAQGALPKTELAFRHTSIKGKESRMQTFEGELNTIIDWRAADLKAYDGPKLRGGYIGDEVLKTTVVDVYERHNVVKECCMADGEFIGKMYYTSTVEKDEDKQSKKENDAAYNLWRDSNQSKRVNNRTITGLFKYLTPAYETLYWDEYGYPLREKAKEYYYHERKRLEGNPKALAGYIRRNPFTEEEMFMSDSDHCPFSVMAIQDALRYCHSLPPGSDEIEVQGDFIWKDKDKEAMFVPNNVNGKWFVSWLPPEVQRNKVKDTGKQDENRFLPLNDERFGFGGDPVSSGKEAEHGSSSAAAAIYRKFDIHYQPERSDTFVADYVYDPDNVEDYYEDMIIACFFFGVQLHCEKNKFDIYNYFKRRGYNKFMMTRPGNTFSGVGKTDKNQEAGTYASEPIIELYINRLKTFWATKAPSVRNKRILEDALKFRYSNRGKRDLTVATGFTMLAVEKPYEPKVQYSGDVSKFFTYKRR